MEQQAYIALYDETGETEGGGTVTLDEERVILTGWMWYGRWSPDRAPAVAAVKRIAALWRMGGCSPGERNGWDPEAGVGYVLSPCVGAGIR